MSKTKIIDLVRKFCSERRKGAGQQKYICTKLLDSSFCPTCGVKIQQGL